MKHQKIVLFSAIILCSITSVNAQQNIQTTLDPQNKWVSVNLDGTADFKCNCEYKAYFNYSGYNDATRVLYFYSMGQGKTGYTGINSLGHKVKGIKVSNSRSETEKSQYAHRWWKNVQNPHFCNPL